VWYRRAVEQAVVSSGSERVLTVHGRHIQLFEGGTGRPLLYLHGAGTFWWMPVHDLLAARRRVFLPVHPGFGASEGLDAIETMEDLVFHTVDVLDALRLDRIDVVGLSLGGWLGAELALRHPARVNRLVLVDAAGVRLPGVSMGNPFMMPPPKVRELTFHDPTLPVAKAILPDAPPPERLETVLRGREASARLLWSPAQQYRKLTSRLWRITAPTLVVWGREDRLIPLAYGEAYARGISGARLEVLDRCGHLPPFEHPERFAEIVHGFLGGEPPASHARVQ
jgi:pimeloyl-ACP methyl ester carboxylesterase